MSIKPDSANKARYFNVANVIASAKIEGITPTQHLEQSLNDYISGKKSIAELLEETKLRHVTLRRG